MKSRSEIIEQAIKECITEMYKWAQPSINIEELLKSDFKDSKDNPLYTKHYLSSDNYDYIKTTYAEAYGIVDEWDDTFELIYKQLSEGGIEDDYKPATEERPGYRDYKKVDPLKEHLTSEADFATVIKYLEKIQYFFKGHCRETNTFSMNIALGCSPTSNAKAVEKYWQENGRPNFKIKEFSIADVLWHEGDFEYTTEEEFISTLK